MIQPSNTPGPFVTIVTVFPGSIFSHCREDRTGGCRCGSEYFMILLAGSPISTHMCTMKCSLGFPLQQQFREQATGRAHPQQAASSAATQQAAPGQVTPQRHQNLTNCRGLGQGDLYTQRSRKAQFNTTISTEEPWTGMCLPGDKEKLLSSDHRSEKFLNYTPRSLTRGEIQHFKILEGRHCAKTHIKAQPP